MSDLRDRIAAVVCEHVIESGSYSTDCCCGWKPTSPGTDLIEYGQHVADALIAAGVTMPATACGSTAVVCGNKFVCDQPPHPGEPHQCTDSIGVMRWRDTPQGALVVSARTHPGSAGWPIHRAGECF